MRIIKLIPQISMVFALLVFAAASALACDCYDPSVRKKFRQADTVFFGELIELKERPEDKTNKEFREYIYDVTFKVEKQWKGKKQSVVKGLGSYEFPFGPCSGSKMPVGKRFLIYSVRKSGQLLIEQRMCSFNWEESEYSRKEIKKLDDFFYRAYTFFYPFPKLR